MRAQAYTLDSIASLLILLITISIIAQIEAPRVEVKGSSDGILGVLLSDYELQNAIYSANVKEIEEYLRPLGKYYLAVYDSS